MFDLLSHNRASLAFQTELLEACDWDEEEMDKVLAIASVVLNEVRLPDIPCPLDHYLDMAVKPALLEEKILENQVNTIIKFIKHDAKFVKWMMHAEEV